ncbi:MAG TPA: NYN domain-containing protein [Vicinamibacterales bacterium]|nr:NYN domain-containing protein [Vicinamibacterales bacterium]
MNPSDTRSTRIAVFIDFDNVEIGVKSTIGGQFDIGLVLEAIKERGEIVTKIAYSDWKRAGDYSRILTQHAIRMVQRNLTPGGDKNGADITMALDALEMAFTHDHINAFVIVGGDSDFISLVEKLKQYGRKVIVVGGRQFTSTTMQKNCHEFIAYENLAGSRGRSTERGRPGGTTPIAQALPLVKRALKVLSEREVAPQLGLLKSTLLQLDSTFSEREYGAGSFRDFMEKVSQTGAVTLKSAGRSMLVETRDEGDVEMAMAPEVGPAAASSIDAARPLPADESEEEETLPPSPMSMQDGIRAVQRAFTRPEAPPRWPMYVRQAKQFLRNAIEGFDERKYGFASVVDLLRAAAREGVLRLERDRQGAVRVFPGQNLEAKAAPPLFDAAVVDDSEPEVMAEVVAAEIDTAADTIVSEPIEEPPIVDVPSSETMPAAEDVTGNQVDEEEEDEVDGNRLEPVVPKTRRRPASPRAAKTSRSKAKTAHPANRRRPDSRAKPR